MNSESIISNSLVGGKEKKPQTNVKLEWVFGIRKDILPNIYMLDPDTLVYPASHYIVIYNLKKMTHGQVQQFIQGTPHSKGFVAFNVLVTKNDTGMKKYVAVAEEIAEGVAVNVFSLVNAQGMYNLPQRVFHTSLYDLNFTKVQHLAFSQRDQPGNNYFALVGVTDEPTLVLWKWEGEHLKDRLVYILKLPNIPYKNLQVSFSCYRNDHFCIITDTFFQFYTCKPFDLKSNFILQEQDFGSKIYSHCWFCDGNYAFSICTDKSIVLFDSQFKILQTIDTLREEINDTKSCITTVLPMLDMFIAAGSHRRFEIYERKSDYFELTAEKKVFEFSHNINEKFDKNSNSEKLTENSDKEKIFNFLTLASPVGVNDLLYVVATTSFNDIIQISTNTKDIDKQLVKHVVAPFHSESIEGMDVCINKPYLITCSLDRNLRVWDYKKKSLVLSKTFDEEMYSVAYHPNGMHAVVSFPDKILPLHIFYDEISNMTQNAISLKSNSKTKDIKFSNGGHLFAFDSGSRVEIWDFLNMVPYTLMNNPCKKIFGSNKLNAINWRSDDQFLLISGYENFYEWQLPGKNDYTKRYEHRNYNITCGGYLGNTFNTVVMTDDGYIRKINADSINSYSDSKYENLMKEMVMFQQTKYMICCTQIPEKEKNSGSGSNNNNSNNISIGNNQIGTTCLRLFTDINSKEDFIDIPSHYGETLRVRVSSDESMIFSCGADGCINIYSIDWQMDGEDSDRLFLDKISDYYTSTVLIKKSKLKEKELERIDLPEKREEKLKKVKAENAEKKDKLKKDLETIKNNLAITKQTEQKFIDQKRNELHALEHDYEAKITLKRNQYTNEYEKLMNDYQIELAGKSREVEKIREALRDHKSAHKEEINNLKREHEEKRQMIEKEFTLKISSLESHKTQLEEQIKTLGDKKELDTNTIEWLNGKVLKVIEKNIEDLKRGIEDLSVHNAHQIKKLKEEKEKLNTQFSNLELERKQMSEEREKQERNTQINKEKKATAEQEMKQIQKRITEVEEKIIEGKKRNQYLEKCKFVLDYKIKELKKEMGPVEKAIEDLKKITKNYDVELEKFNREHEIISKKLVDFKELDNKIEELKKEERDERNLIKEFKNTIFNMINNIDDFEFLRKEFRRLRDTFLKDYYPDKQDMELDAEFFNQKDNMRKNVEDLQKQLRSIKVKHVDSIEQNRKDNHQLIKRITKLQTDIKSEKDRKGEQAADSRHANAIAAIKAQKKINDIDEMEFESMDDKISFLEEMIEKKKRQLNKEKGIIGDSEKILPNDGINETNNSQDQDDI